MTQQVRVPDTVYEKAKEVQEEKDFSSIGDTIRYMCQKGDYDV
ncbi:hypothetical protein [Natrarchaeobaculum sulfurireducens]|nr:hypothetical protein [Natrarchaeobaculum sulfurireducens]